MYKRSFLTIVLGLLFTGLAYAGWTPAVLISDEAPSYGPRMVANGDTLHVVYWTWTGTSRSYYLNSINGGDSWETPFRLGDSLIAGSEVSPLIRNTGDTIAAIWSQNLPGGDRYNWGLRLSTNAGLTWGEISYILPSDNYSIQKHTFYIMDSRILLICSRIDQQEIVVEFTKSTNLGDTWTSPTEIFRTQQTGQFDMVAQGDTIHFVWIGRFDSEEKWETYYVKSENSGYSWTSNMALSTLDDRGSLWPSISMNEEGDLIACWMDFKYSSYVMTGDIFIRYSYDGGDNWTPEEQLTFNHRAHANKILWSGDSIHVVWEDWRDGQLDIYYMLSTNNGLTWENEQRVEDDPGMSLAPDLALSEENVHVVWRQDTGMTGRGIYYSRFEDETVIIGEDEGFLPEQFTLKAHPNPFNSRTILTYKNLKGGEIEIYNITGQKIRTLTTANNKEGQIEWDARDALGNKVSTGIYFARARAPQNSNTLKLLYLK